MPAPSEVTYDKKKSPIKRDISVMEKGTVLNTEGWWFLFPSLPFPEVQEVVDAGGTKARILGVEKDEALAKAIMATAKNEFQVEWGLASDVLAATALKFCYMHLDFTGSLIRDQWDEIESCMNKLAPVARLRLSWSWGRQDDGKWADHLTPLTKSIIIPFLHLVLDTDENPERWPDIIASFKAEASGIPIAALMVYLNHTFGLTLDTMRDLFLVKGKIHLPYPEGTHTVHNLHFETYRDKKLPMHTLWVDCVQFDPASVVNVEQYVIDNLYHYLTAATTYKDDIS